MRAGADGSRMRRIATVPAASVVVVAAALLVVVAARFIGPAHLHNGPANAVPLPSIAAQSAHTPPATARPADTDVIAVVLEILLLVLAAALIALLLLLLVQLLRAWAGRRRSRARRVEGVAVGDVAVDAAAEPAAVRRGIAASLALMEEDLAPRDAILQAWVGLQQTAGDAGLPRRSAETPTEFAVRVLARTTADGVAARRLLALYLAARFGDDPSTEDDVAAARSALEALQASWSVVETEGVR